MPAELQIEPMRSDRLWPVLLVLAVLLSGAGTLEWAARRSENAGTVIRIQSGDNSRALNDDGEPEEEVELDEATPVSEEHAQARLAARRGEFDLALKLFARAAETHQEAAAVHADYGYWLLKSGRPAEAIPELERAQALNPSSALVALNLGAARKRALDLPGAEREFRKAVALRPSYVSAKIALGVALLKRGALSEAIEILKDASRYGGNEDRAQALVSLGRAYLRAGRRSDAERAFGEAVARAPSLVQLRVSVAQAWLGTGKREDVGRALEIAVKAAELGPDQPDAQVVLARVRERSGDRLRAIEGYRKVLQLDSRRTYAVRRLLRLALDQQNFAEARAHADRLLEIDKGAPEHHFLAGLVAAREQRISEARAQYAASIRAADGNYPEAYFNLGILEKRAGNLEAAITAYNEALKLRPTYLAVLNNLGLALSAIGRESEAHDMYRRAIAEDAKYATAWLNLGELLLRRQDFDGARAAFQGALAARPDYAQAALSLGLAYEKLGRRDDALATYRALCKAHPRNAQAFRRMGRLLEARAAFDDARAAYDKAVGLDPENPEYLVARAELGARVGDFALAGHAYEELLERDPGDRGARLALADVRRRAGDLNGCRREAERVLQVAADETRAKTLKEQCGGLPSN